MGELTGIDVHSQTWRNLVDWAHAELEEIGSLLETPGLPGFETEFLRGRASQLRGLLKSTEPSKIPVQRPSEVTL